MPEIIDFREPSKPNVPAAVYRMKTEIDGVTRIIELTGDETFYIGCPKCERTISYEFTEFINVMHGGSPTEQPYYAMNALKNT